MSPAELCRAVQERMAKRKKGSAYQPATASLGQSFPPELKAKWLREAEVKAGHIAHDLDGADHPGIRQKLGELLAEAKREVASLRRELDDG